MRCKALGVKHFIRCMPTYVHAKLENKKCYGKHKWASVLSIYACLIAEHGHRTDT